MHRIGEFSKLAKTTIKTLRYYDEVGLLKPASVNPENSYRYYRTEQLLDLCMITALRQTGLSISDIKRVLDSGELESVLSRHRESVSAQVRELSEQLSRIESILSVHEEEFFMKYQAMIKQLPAGTVYYKRGVIEDFSKIEAFILSSADECLAANPNMRCTEPDYGYVTYLDPEFKHQNIALEYAQQVVSAGVETDIIKFKEIKPVEAVCVYHRGPYETIGEAYAWALNWVQQNGYELAENPRECYIDGKWNREDPADWLTEIQIPIKRA
ncbi:MerR family transcriptional regulator [Candidatus Soleaferrea massiliensis]|uniref:MerR family transcriptional regulator n=1 Tax=Candidatus Soleaferrea massiliensis TaxID=1470354 RepID=UPI00058C805E|nr:MerR family transcriptional regulator [Candidatus Soleaferrea massiliensis]